MTLPNVQAEFFDLRSAFQAALLDVIATAESELLLFDPTYADWPGGAPALEAALTRFLRAGKRPRLWMVVDDFDRIVRDYPRLANLLRTYAHDAECRKLAERYANLDETMIVVDAATALRRPSARSYRGVVRRLDVEYAKGQRERFLELWDACTERYSPTSLGL